MKPSCGGKDSNELGNVHLLYLLRQIFSFSHVIQVIYCFTVSYQEYYSYM